MSENWAHISSFDGVRVAAEWISAMDT
jgi:hypothetical protein